MLSLLLLLFLPFSAPADLSSNLDRILALIQETMSCHGMRDVSYGIVVGNQTVSGSFRLHRDGRTTPESPSRQFCIGSLTKAFTAAAYGLLRDEFSFNFDTKITDLIKVPVFSTEFLNKAITVRDVLSHRTGLDAFHNLIFFGNTMATREEISDKVSYLQFRANDYQSRFRYNNILYGFMGYVMEKATGETWEELLRRLIFLRLGMHDTIFFNQVPNSNKMTQNFVFNSGEWIEVPQNRYLSLDVYGPAISLCTTGSDMTKWIKFLLNTRLSGELFSQGVSLDRPVDEIFHSGELMLDFAGMGWYGGFYRGAPLFYHGGFLYGYESSLWILPENKIGIYLATNSIKGEKAVKVLGHLTENILNILSEHPVSVLSHPCDLVVNRPTPFCICSPPRTSSIYEGWFSHPIGGVVQIFPKNRGLEMAFGKHGRAMLCKLSDFKFGVMVLNFESKYFPYCEKCRFPGFCHYEMFFLFSGNSPVATEIIIPFLEPENPPTFRRMP